jgi:heme A synthase
MVGFGLFLAMIGILGFLSNPDKAKTALVSGGGFGFLSIVLGIFLRRGFRWARGAAVAMTALLAIVFVWRAIVGWVAVIQGQAEKRTAAILITSMLAASILTLMVLLRSRSDKKVDEHP